MNAKHHILHDLRSSTLTGNSATALAYINAQVAKQQLLTYDVFAERASQQPSHPFLIFEGRTWTYREFFQAVNRVGRWLSEELGVRCGEIVAVDGGNSPEYLMLWFALDGLGAAPSFINWNLTGGALVYSVKVSEARVGGEAGSVWLRLGIGSRAFGLRLRGLGAVVRREIFDLRSRCQDARGAVRG